MPPLSKRLPYITFLFPALVFFTGNATAQYLVKGTVLDDTKTYPIASVTVMSTNGGFTLTDSSGRYAISVGEKDSIWFSYQGKPTPKYPVMTIQDVTQFNISLRIKMDVMPEVRIHTRSYINDSLENRRAYARIFDYEKPSLGTMTSVGAMGAGIDVNELIRLFQFRKNKSMLRFQQRLVNEERDKFIDRRFNKSLVRQLTGLEGEALDQFMQTYRPTYEFTAMASDYDFRYFIKIAAEQFMRKKPL